MTNLKKIVEMTVFLASGDCSSPAVRSRSGSWLLPPVQCQYLGVCEEDLEVLHFHHGGGNMRAFPAPTLPSGNTVSVQQQRRVRWPACYFEADIWIGVGSIVISASCTKISVTLGMSSATVERQCYGLGKALRSILLQSQHTQGCGRGELRGVRKLKADQ